MNEKDVQALADDVLGPLLGPVGFTNASVEARPDHAGEESWYITAHFEPGSAIASGSDYLRAQVAVEDALKAEGDHRFPYFRYISADDPLAFDEAEAYGS